MAKAFRKKSTKTMKIKVRKMVRLNSLLPEPYKTPSVKADLTFLSKSSTPLTFLALLDKSLAGSPFFVLPNIEPKLADLLLLVCSRIEFKFLSD